MNKACHGKKKKLGECKKNKTKINLFLQHEFLSGLLKGLKGRRCISANC